MVHQPARSPTEPSLSTSLTSPYIPKDQLGRVRSKLTPESDPNFKGYANGNEEPGRGFGHICIGVDDLEAACKRFDELGVKFKKRPEEGRMRVSRL